MTTTLSPIIEVTNPKPTAVTMVRHDPESRRGNNKFVLYVTSPLADLIDKEFFRKHRIWDLEFKCAAWAAVARTATAEIIAEASPVLAARFSIPQEALTLAFSRKAGCSCGCSPGYVGTLTRSDFVQDLSRSNVWMDVACSAVALERVTAEMNKQAARLPAEIARHKAKVIAEAREAGAAYYQANVSRYNEPTPSVPREYRAEPEAAVLWIDGFMAAKTARNAEANARLSNASLTGACL
jgi:hypothetical protein